MYVMRIIVLCGTFATSSRVNLVQVLDLDARVDDLGNDLQPVASESESQADGLLPQSDVDPYFSLKKKEGSPGMPKSKTSWFEKMAARKSNGMPSIKKDSHIGVDDSKLPVKRSPPEGLKNASIISDWASWLNQQGRSLGNRLGWFAGPDYEVRFGDIVSPDVGKPCSVTFIADLTPEGMILNVFARKVLKMLASDKTLPKEETVVKGLGDNASWKKILFTSKCLSIGLDQNGIGHLHGVGTEWAKRYGGGGCLDKGKLLVQLADLVACKFNMQTMQGLDSSMLACRSDPTIRVQMGLFYAIKTGTSWYESLGYEYTAGTSGNFSAAMAPLAAYRAVLGQRHQHLLDPYKAEVGESEEGASGRDFSLWVWENHCVEWEDVVEVMFQVSRFKSRLKGDMRKGLDCDSIRASSPLVNG